MKYCPRCNKIDYDETSAYCSKCGQTLTNKPLYLNNNQNLNIKISKKSSKKITITKILIIFIVYFIILYLSVIWMGYGTLLFMVPMFFVLIAWSAKMLAYQLSPEEQSDENGFKRIYNYHFDDYKPPKDQNY